MTDALALVRLDSARQALMESRDLSEVKAIHDQAEAMRQYATAQRMGLEAQNHAAQISLLAARRAGELIASMERSSGGRPSENSCHAGTGLRAALRASEIAPSQAYRWVNIAAVPEPIYEQHVAETLAKPNGELTSAAVVKLANDLKRNQPASDAPITAPEPSGRFTTIVADPPWQYTNVATRAAAQDHYPTLTVPQVCSLQPWGKLVSELAEDAAHLYLWTTNAFLRDAFDVVTAWGFEYKTTLVWVKKQLGIGNYFRSSHEFVLFGVRGGLRVLDSNQFSWFEDEGAGFKSDRGRHSQKPDYFYDLAQKVSPGPYLELFARTDLFPRDGWTYWGNEA